MAASATAASRAACGPRNRDRKDTGGEKARAGERTDRNSARTAHGGQSEQSTPSPRPKADCPGRWRWRWRWRALGGGAPLRMAPPAPRSTPRAPLRRRARTRPLCTRRAPGGSCRKRAGRAAARPRGACGVQRRAPRRVRERDQSGSASPSGRPEAASALMRICAAAFLPRLRRRARGRPRPAHGRNSSMPRRFKANPERPRASDAGRSTPPASNSPARS